MLLVACNTGCTCFFTSVALGACTRYHCAAMHWCTPFDDFGDNWEHRKIDAVDAASMACDEHVMEA